MSVFGPRPDFDAENGFLHAFLGLIAASSEGRALLETEQSAGSADASEEEDDILFALLGIVRISELVSRVADSWATTDPGPLASSEEPMSSRVEGIFR